MLQTTHQEVPETGALDTTGLFLSFVLSLGLLRTSVFVRSISDWDCFWPKPKPGSGADADPSVGTAVADADFVVGLLNGVPDPDDDNKRPTPRPGLLESPRFVLVAICAGKESDSLPPPNDRPPEAEEEPKLNPAAALVVTGLAIAETPVPADEYEETTGFEIEEGAPKGGCAGENPLLIALSSLAGDIAS